MKGFNSDDTEFALCSTIFVYRGYHCIGILAVVSEFLGNVT